MPYIAVRKDKSLQSDVQLLIHYPLTEGGSPIARALVDHTIIEQDRVISEKLDCHLTGQFLYSISGLNRWPWRDVVACSLMNDTEASPYTEMGCFPIHEAEIVHMELTSEETPLNDVQFDRFKFDPKDFQVGGTMGCFGRMEREDRASLVIWAAQQHGTFKGEFNVLEVCKALWGQDFKWLDWNGMDEDHYKGGGRVLGRDTSYTNSSPVFIGLFERDGVQHWLVKPAFIDVCLQKVTRVYGS